MKKDRVPQLKIFATGWTFGGYPDVKKPWTAEKILDAALKAGFDGIQTRANQPLAKLARTKGIPLLFGCDIGRIRDIEPAFREVKAMGGRDINVQLCDHDTPTKKALPVAVQIIKIGKKMGLKPAIEWHRDTCTETPEKALALADAYEKRTGKKLRMNPDHSHPAIIKHLAPQDYWKRLGVRLDLLQKGSFIHFRPFNGHHCQIPVTDGKGRLSPEFQDWLPFCEKVIEAWLQGAKAGSTLIVVPELGPKGGYGLSCFPDLWKDKQVLAKEIRKIWNRKIKRWKKS